MFWSIRRIRRLRRFRRFRRLRRFRIGSRDEGDVQALSDRAGH